MPRLVASKTFNLTFIPYVRFSKTCFPVERLILSLSVHFIMFWLYIDRNGTIVSGDKLAFAAAARMCASFIPRMTISVMSSSLNPLTIRNRKIVRRTYSLYDKNLSEFVHIVSNKILA